MRELSGFHLIDEGDQLGGRVGFTIGLDGPVLSTGGGMGRTMFSGNLRRTQGETADRHVFISYAREDTTEVLRIQRVLEAAGVRVWRDTANLWPGEDWRTKIRQAITSDSLVFLACFSDHSERRTTTYQNEELLLAIDELRRRHPGQPWLIPIRLSDCALPQYDLGAGRTLDSFQRIDLFGEEEASGLARLIDGVRRVLSSLEMTRIPGRGQ